jgi:hypothetical protein
MKAFVITKQGWEYNDEYYYQTEEDGGPPVKVYLNKAKAEEDCKKRNQLQVLEGLGQHFLNLFEIGGDWNELGALSEASVEWLKARGVEPKHGWENYDANSKLLREHVAEMDLETFHEFYQTLSASFFEVAEVELDDETLEARG